MPDDLRGALRLEDAPDPESVESPVIDADDDGEPDGAVEVGGRRMVDVSVVAAERKRAREKGAKDVRDKELAPLQEKASRSDALQQALDAARPYVDIVKQHPHLLQPQKPTAEEDSITDDQAAVFARQYELYQAADGQPDVKRAKKIMADNRREIAQVAKQAVSDAVAPMQAATADDRSKQNFARMCALTDEAGQPLVDPEFLAKEWVQLDVSLTQDPAVAEVVLERALGKSMRSKSKGRVAAPVRSPVFSESPGGRPQASVGLSGLDKKLGITEKDLKETQGKFVPGGVSTFD